MATIIDQLIAAKLARNPWHATKIANGLKLADMANDDERMERARLYRAWRDAGFPPNEAFRNAIDGRDPMRLPLPRR